MKYAIFVPIVIIIYILANFLNRKQILYLINDLEKFKNLDTTTYLDIEQKMEDIKYKLLISKKMRSYILLISKIQFYLSGNLKLKNSIIKEYPDVIKYSKNDLVATFNINFYWFYFNLQDKTNAKKIIEELKKLNNRIKTGECYTLYQECLKSYENKWCK